MDITVIVTSKPNDPTNAAIFELLEKVKQTQPIKVVVLGPAENEKIANLPQVEIGPYKLRGQITEQQLVIAIRAASDRKDQILKIEKAKTGRNKKIHDTKFSLTDKFSYWFSNNYMVVLNFIVFLYFGIPFLAPILMHLGLTQPAGVIYKIYSYLCHQLAFRSFFLYGPQIAYPRLLSGLHYPIMYENLIGHTTINVNEARAFLGNAVYGYKIALCERDVAMYSSFFFFGMVFAFFKTKIKSIKMWMWIVLGILPIAIDGGSQLPALGLDIKWLPARESTPLLRVITGILFGVFTAWYLYPMIEDTMQVTRKSLWKKKQIVRQLKTQTNA